MKGNFIVYLKKFTVPVLVIIVIITCCFTVIFPKIKIILTIQKKTKIQNNDIKILTEKINQLKTLSEAELISDLQVLLEYLPEENDIFKSILVIRQLTKENNIMINEISFSPGLISSNSASVSEPKKITSSLIKMEISGNLDDQKIFLSKMEKVFPLMGIDGVKITSSPAGTDSGQLSNSSEMSIIVYFKPIDNKKLDYFDALPKISASSDEIIKQIKSYERIIPQVSSDSPVMVGRESLF